jgi:hypothetical protein
MEFLKLRETKTKENYGDKIVINIFDNFLNIPCLNHVFHLLRSARSLFAAAKTIETNTSEGGAARCIGVGLDSKLVSDIDKVEVSSRCRSGLGRRPTQRCLEGVAGSGLQWDERQFGSRSN